jgi:Secretion system C-terminal sorting domain
MKNFNQKYLLSTLILLLASFCQVSLAQFKVVPLQNIEKSKFSPAKIMALSLPFFDDFSTSINTQDLFKWQKSGGVFINNTFTTNHPTLNVATFDGLKADGSPYDFSNPLAQGATDSLTSMPIDLSGKSIADSLYLSFFYRGQGLGEKPDLRDSLRLQFLTNGNLWKTIWIDSAKTVSDVFVNQILPVNAQIYFHDKFQFRFQSYGKQSGQFDVWHIDYVYLDEIKNGDRSKGLLANARSRSIKNPTTKAVIAIFPRDIAVVNPISSVLKRYNSMPWIQLMGNETKELADTITTNVYNLNLNQSTPKYTYSVKNLLNGEVLQNRTFDAFQISSKGLSTLKVKNQITVKTKLKLKLKFDLDSGDSLIYKLNDTISRVVELDNYYAYDDGTAEQAAYLKKGFGRVAVQYNLNKPDAVTAIRIHVPPTVTNLTGKRLTLQIMSDKDGKPDRILKTISDSTTTIKYANTPNAFIEYKIKDSVTVEGTFYVGYVQFTDDEPLVLGLDLNSPQFTNKHFYNISNEWINVGTDVDKTNTSNTIKGSLMIRPVMAGKTARTITLATEEELQDKNLVISPNPSTGIFRWNDVSLKNAEVFDMTGRAIFQEKTNNQEVNLQSLNTGVYFLRLSNEKNTFVRKIVKE